MAVTSVTIWATRPGRAIDFVASAAQAKAIHERLGGKVRLMQITFGGPTSQQFVYTVEVPDMTAFAAFSDKMNGDAEWNTFWTAANNPDPTATLVSQSLLTDLRGF